ncbi:unnamed protein product, partial [Rotaria magnacalcarata]
MSSNLFDVMILLLVLIHVDKIWSIPACIIIDTNMIQQSQDDTSLTNNHSSSGLFVRNLRMLNGKRLSSSSSSDFVFEPIPLSYIDIKQTTPSPLINIDNASLKKSIADPIVDQSFSPCPLNLLNEIETQMVVPFEFRRLRVEQ